MNARTHVPEPIISGPGVLQAILAYGSSDPAVVEARDLLKEVHGKDTDYLRVRALPFSDTVERFIAAHDVVYVVEQNRDGQMTNLLREFFPHHSYRFHKVLHYDSTAITAQTIVDQINGLEK